MPRNLAAVDLDEGVIWIEWNNGLIGKYDISMFAAAVQNPKYWEDATLEEIADGVHIPDIILEDFK